MDELTKRQMIRLNNLIVVVCIVSMIGIVLLRKSECDCIKVKVTTSQTQIANNIKNEKHEQNKQQN
jgi:hypothetical protein